MRNLAASASLAFFIGMVHTGCNVHGGNPTLFGVPERSPLLGITLIVGAFVLTPVVFRLFGGRRL